MVDERRRSLRLALDVSAKYSPCDIPLTQPARVTEISTGGVRLLTGEEMRLGTILDLAFVVPFPAERSQISVQVRARVVRLIAVRDGIREYGLRAVDDIAARSSLRSAVLKINLAKARDIRAY